MKVEQLRDYLTGNAGLGRLQTREGESMAKLVLADGYIGVEGVWSSAVDDEFYSGKKKSSRSRIADPQDDLFEPRAKRGTIVDFTRASQARLMKTISMWRPIGQMIMITLTYPSKWPSAERVTQDFKRFKDMLRSDYPAYSGCWKLEYQVRGAPHFHMVLDCGAVAPNMKSLDKWAFDVWNKIRRHEGYTQMSRVRVERIRDNSAGKYYLTKEVGKTVQASQAWLDTMENDVKHSGRFWGWHNKKSLSVHCREYFLPAALARHLQLYVRKANLKAMMLAGIVEFKSGEHIYKNTGQIVDMERLRSWRILHCADTFWLGVVEHFEGVYSLDIESYLIDLELHTPP